MHEVVIQTSEPGFAREATKILVKILNSTYANEDHKEVDANTT